MLPKSMIRIIVKYIELNKKNDAMRHFLKFRASDGYSSPSLIAKASVSTSASNLTSESSAATSLILAS